MVDAEDEVVELCRALIRVPSVNDGTGAGPCERPAAELVVQWLSEVGLTPQVFEPAPNRTSVVVRWEGEDRSRPALLVHGHLDVVPATASDWSHDPFGADLADGCVWGRGAVDMKGMDAMVLAVVRQWAREGRRPPRDVVLAFLADEENGGVWGAQWLVEHRPELFEGVTEAISEVGGYSLTVRDDLRLYLVETAQKGLKWLRLSAAGRAGHGSMEARDNAVVTLAAAVVRLGEARLPVHETPTVEAFLAEVREAFGLPAGTPPDEVVDALGPLSRFVRPLLRNTAVPTVLQAGANVNVVPARATATVDGRFLPGFEEAFDRELDEVLGPRITREVVQYDEALETTFDGPLVDAMCAAIRAEDPQGRPIPYVMAAASDNKVFARHGIRTFGFSPLRLPADLDFSGMFHGVDERVPVDALRFGVRVLSRFLAAS